MFDKHCSFVLCLSLLLGNTANVACLIDIIPQNERVANCFKVNRLRLFTVAMKLCYVVQFFCVTVDRRYVFSLLKLEKLLSAVQLVTGNVRYSRLVTSGRIYVQASLSLNN